MNYNRLDNEENAHNFSTSSPKSFETQIYKMSVIIITFETLNTHSYIFFVGFEHSDEMIFTGWLFDALTAEAGGCIYVKWWKKNMSIVLPRSVIIFTQCYEYMRMITKRILLVSSK